MTMPRNLLLIRHGESEGNVTLNASKNGDTSGFTEEFMTTPGRYWNLTEKGRQQAACVGEWLRTTVLNPDQGCLAIPSRFYVSPYTRTRQTAATLDYHWYNAAEHAPDRARVEPRWYLNRTIRERDWGDIGAIPRVEFRSRPEYALSSRQQKIDPLYWRPPGGESIVDVAENRVRNFLDTLHRETSSASNVLAVTHGEFMWATRLLLERLDDETFDALDNTPAEKIRNCEVMHYTSVHPDGPLRDEYGRERVRSENRLAWVRRARPILTNGVWGMQVGEWRRFDYQRPTNSELLLAPTT